MTQRIPPAMPVQNSQPGGDPFVRMVAVAQRRLIWAILGAFIFGILAVAGAVITTNSPAGLNLTTISLDLVRLVFVVFMMVCVYQLSAALGDGMAARVLFVIAMILPVISLIVLLVQNQRATGLLKGRGVRVGFMGANLADLQQT